MATVIAYDENGNTFKKQVNFYNSNDRSTLNPETLDEYLAIISLVDPYLIICQPYLQVTMHFRKETHIYTLM